MHDDPWAPPEAREPAGPRPRRGPAAVAMVFGVLSIAWGAIGLLGVPIGVAAQFAPPTSNHPEVDRVIGQVYRDSPAYRVGVFLFGALGLGATALLLVAGVGLVMARTWGRRLALVYSGLSLVIAAASVAFQAATLIIPVYTAVPQDERAYAFGRTVAPAFGALAGAVYPAGLGAVLIVPAVARTFGRDGAGPLSPP